MGGQHGRIFSMVKADADTLIVKPESNQWKDQVYLTDGADGNGPGFYLKNSDGSYTFVGGIASIPYSRTVFVDTNFGNDATATGERFDKPFKTVDAAILYARANEANIDLIYVREGSDTIFQEMKFKTPTLLGTESRFYFEGGNFTVTSSTRTLVNGTTTDITILGFANFTFTNFRAFRGLTNTSELNLYIQANFVSCNSIYYSLFGSVSLNLNTLNSNSGRTIEKYNRNQSQDDSVNIKVANYLGGQVFLWLEGLIGNPKINIGSLTTNAGGFFGNSFIQNVANSGQTTGFEWNGNISASGSYGVLFLFNGFDGVGGQKQRFKITGNFIYENKDVICSFNSTPTGGTFLFENCTFKRLGGTYNGATYGNVFGVDQTSSLVIKDCIIDEDVAYSMIGSGTNFGFGADGTSKVEVNNCSVTNNATAGTAGSVLFSSSNSLLKVMYTEIVSKDPAQLSLDASAPSTAIQVYNSVMNNANGLNVTNGLTGIPIDVNANLVNVEL